MEAGQLNKKIGFVIQARMGSSRLPGKILLPFPLDANIPLIGRIVNSLKNSRFSPTIIIATSTAGENDKLQQFCQEKGISCFRGAEEDVLSRFEEIQKMQNFDVIVRFTGDNPIVDVTLLDKTINGHLDSGADYTWTNELPVGMNFEVFNARILESLPQEELTDQDKEHVTLFLKRSGKYSLNNLQFGLHNKYSDVRLTVDYPSDFLVASSVFTFLEQSGKSVLEVFDHIQDKYPWIFEINKKNYQRQHYSDIREELKYAKPILKDFGFNNILEKLQQDE